MNDNRLDRFGEALNAGAGGKSLGVTVYKIGDLAREFNVTLRTLRFYEDRGLITPTRDGTTRLYSNEQRERLKVVLFGKKVGFSLNQIKELLRLHESDQGSEQTHCRLNELYKGQICSLNDQISELGEAIELLTGKLKAV
ncbi:MAG: MerR family transcriptional regulator [Pseudomonadota bacterium]